MALAALATMIVQYAEDGGPLTESPTWATVTSYSLDASISRGKSGWLSSFQAGTANIALKSFAREFDPDYASRLTGFGLGRQVRIRATVPVGGTTYDLFRGHIEDCDQFYDTARNDTVQITAVDLLGILGSYDLEKSAHATVVKSLGPDAWWQFDTNDFVMPDASGHGRTASTTVLGQEVAPLEPGGVGALQYAFLSAGSLGLSTTDFTVNFLVRGVQQATIVVDDGFGGIAIVTPLPVINLRVGGLAVTSTGATYASATATYPATAYDGNTHYVSVVRDGDDLTIYVDGVAGTTATGAGVGAEAVSTMGLQTTAVVDEMTLFASALSAGDIGDLAEAGLTGWLGDRSDVRIQRILDIIGVPSGRYSLEVGTSSCGPLQPGSALAHLQAVAAGEDGRLFCDAAGVIQFHAKTHDWASASAKTFSDDGTVGDVPFASFSNRQSRRDVINEVTVSSPAGPGVAADATSQTAYGRKTATVTTMLSDANTAKDLADTILGRVKDAATRPGAWTAQVGASASDTWAGDLDLGDKVTRQFTPAGTGAQLSKTDVVDHITHRINPSTWAVTYTAAPFQQTAYAIWGTDVWDTGTWSF